MGLKNHFASIMTNKNQSSTATTQETTNSDKTILIPASDSTSDDKTRVSPQTEQPIQNILAADTQEKTVLSTDQDKTKISGTGSLLKNRFDLLEVIGSGGMGTVYKSLDRRDIEAGNSSFIAIKVINDEYKNDSDLLKALHSETRKTQTLAHPNIVTVYDFDRDGDTVFMTMEFIDGAPLDKVIKANPKGMPANKAIKIISNMAQALIYAHSKNIIHLDFKPSNVFVDLKNHVKVFDFGIARLANSAFSRGFDASVLGGLTPSYASLEMFKNETPDPRDDLYALACVSYELFSGQHPFNKASAEIAQQKQLKAKRIKSLNNKQWNTLKQGLAFNRKDRIKDVSTFLQGMTSSGGLSPFVIVTAAVVSIATISLALKFSNFELPTLSISNPKDSLVIEPEIDSIATTKTTIPNQPTIEKPIQTDNKPKEIIKETGSISLWTEKTNYKVGETLQFNFTVDQSMYVKIVTINSLGKLIALFPNPYQTKNYCKPNINYQIPPKNAEFTLDIGEPRGTDKLIAIGSSSPIPDHALNFNSAGEIQDPKLRQSLVYKQISYRIN